MAHARDKSPAPHDPPTPQTDRVGLPGHHVHETAPMHDAVDAWHDHSHDERPQEAHAEVQNTPMIMGVGVALFFVVVASVVVVYGFYTHYTTTRLSALEQTTENSPAFVTRGEQSNSLTLLKAGGTLPLKDADGKERQVRVSPVDQAAAGVVGRYAGGSAAPAKGNGR